MELELRKWQSDEGPIFYALSQEQELYQYMYDDFPKTLEACCELVQDFARSDDSHQYVRAIVFNHEIIGCIGAFFDNERAELAYWLTTSYRHQGIMTKVLQMVELYLYQNQNIREIYAAPFIENKASQHLLINCGFQKGQIKVCKNHQVIEFMKEI